MKLRIIVGLLVFIGLLSLNIFADIPQADGSPALVIEPACVGMSAYNDSDKVSEKYNKLYASIIVGKLNRAHLFNALRTILAMVGELGLNKDGNQAKKIRRIINTINQLRFSKKLRGDAKDPKAISLRQLFFFRLQKIIEDPTDLILTKARVLKALTNR